MKKVILVSVDGMRPDGFVKCGNDFVEFLLKNSTYSLNVRTVYPSVTLPCHLSLFYSEPPERHGTTTNSYSPPVRPINGLFEQLGLFRKVSAMFYGWEPMRQVARFEYLTHASYIKISADESADTVLTERANACIEHYHPDFVYLYLGDTDVKGGHDFGWMSDEYLRRISIAVDNIRKLYEKYGNEYTFIITADHGGHDRYHGTDQDEDMLIPVICIGDEFERGKVIEGLNIMDITPTIADIMDIVKVPEWEGKSFYNR